MHLVRFRYRHVVFQGTPNFLALKTQRNARTFPLHGFPPRRALRVRKKSGGENMPVHLIGDLLASELSHLQPYIRFCSCQLNAAALLQCKTYIQPDFKDFLKVGAAGTRRQPVNRCPSRLTIVCLPPRAEDRHQLPLQRHAALQLPAQTHAEDHALPAAHQERMSGKGAKTVFFFLEVQVHDLPRCFSSLRSWNTRRRATPTAAPCRRPWSGPRSCAPRSTRACGRRRTRTGWSGSRPTSSARGP